MKKAAIDIGTNTVLLLVAEHTGGELKIIEEQQRVPRLGQGVDEHKNLSQDAMDRVIQVLKEYQEVLENKYVDVTEPIVTATSAVRDARNREDFQNWIRKATGFELKVLSGLEEAEYTFLGAQSVLSTAKSNQFSLILDIGGGSTELAAGQGDMLTDRYSFDMGCVRYTERFLDTDIPSKEQISACKNAVQQMLKEHLFVLPPDAQLIGVAGTVTSLAFMDQGLEQYKNSAIVGYEITVDTISEFISRVAQKTTEELISRYPAVMKGRADIFLAGLLILEGVMKKYGFNILTVSTGGIRHGAILLCE